MSVSRGPSDRLSAWWRELRDYGERTRIVYAWELPSIMRKHIFTGAMGSLYFMLLSGIYVVAFGNALGLEHWQWALLSAASSFALLLQLLSAYVVSRIGSRKRLWFISAMVSRLLRGAALGAAFLLSARMPTAARWAFLLLVVAANAFDAFGAPPWLSWLADIIPHEDHGHFMGRRSAWIAVTNLLIVLPVGFLLDNAGEQMKMPALMALFGFGFIVGVMDLLIHRTIPEPPMVVPPRHSFWREVAVPLADRGFRPWLVFNAAWTFSMTLGGALAAVHFVENLGIRRNFLGGGVALVILPLVGSLSTGKIAGRMVDRYGVKRMLRWAHAFWALLPFIWIFATTKNALWVLGLSSLVGGAASTAAMTAASKLTTRLPPSGHVPMYVAVSTCIGALAGGLGPVVAGMVLELSAGRMLTVGPFVFVGFHLLFAASFLLRNAATLLIRRIGEPAAQTA
jgi:MFS family permease